MDNQLLNFIVFFIILLVIIYLSCVDKNYLNNLIKNNENFNNNQNDNQNNNVNTYDILQEQYYRLKTPLVKLSNNGTGWKQLYKDKYLKGNVNYEDCFKGVVTRNYLDNIKFFVN